MSRVESSKQRYHAFVKAYKDHTLEDPALTEHKPPPIRRSGAAGGRSTPRLRELAVAAPLRIAGFFILALITAGLEMIEPLFMRFIIDRVLLNQALDRATRLSHLQLAGAFFVGVIVLGNVSRIIKDYRQKLLNVKVMLSLRQSLFDRLLHLPLSRLWEMKTGGILSRLTGDVETTSGLLQMAVVSPSCR